MKSINIVFLIGHLGRDPEVRYTPSGSAVATFSLATTTRKKNQSGEYTDYTQWHNCVCFGKLAEIVGQYLLKGAKLHVQGTIEYQEYQSEGQTKKATKIIVNELSMLSGNEGGQKNDKFPTPQHNQLHDPLDDGSDIPF